MADVSQLHNISNNLGRSSLMSPQYLINPSLSLKEVARNQQIEFVKLKRNVYAG